MKTQVCLFKTDKLTQVRTLRHPETSTLSFVSAITLSIRSDCFSLTARALESSLRLSLNCRSTAAFIRSPRQLLQSDTGDPHFALDPLTYRCLLSLSPAADFAEPRPPRHNNSLAFRYIKSQIWKYYGIFGFMLNERGRIHEHKAPFRKLLSAQAVCVSVYVRDTFRISTWSLSRGLCLQVRNSWHSLFFCWRLSNSVALLQALPSGLGVNCLYSL